MTTTLEYGPSYEGWFGRLCERVPIFDVSAPDGWQLTYRAYNRTDWVHPEAEVRLTCVKTPSGWDLFVEADGEGYQALPKGVLRWNAFGAARQFLDGGPLMLADPDATIDGPLTLEQFREGGR